MAILIKELTKALEYTPLVPTYAIRIKSSTSSKVFFSSLTSSKNYLAIREYVFDDVYPEGYDEYEDDRPNIIFNANLARDIITDFVDYKDKVQDLLVHCRWGQNRSPAIALAMNQIFNLGEDSDKIVYSSPGGRWWMTNLMLQEARTLGLYSR